MVLADTSVDFVANEGPILVAALAWVIAIGGVAIAAIIICGWRGAYYVSVNWFTGRAVFYCR
jgi:hypothetical protein